MAAHAQARDAARELKTDLAASAGHSLIRSSQFLSNIVTSTSTTTATSSNFDRKSSHTRESERRSVPSTQTNDDEAAQATTIAARFHTSANNAIASSNAMFDNSSLQQDSGGSIASVTVLTSTEVAESARRETHSNLPSRSSESEVRLVAPVPPPPTCSVGSTTSLLRISTAGLPCTTRSASRCLLSRKYKASIYPLLTQ